MSTLIKNGLIMSMVAGEEPYIGSVLVDDNGLIAEIGPSIDIPEYIDVIDAELCLVLPGFIDPHRHCAMSTTRSANGDTNMYQYIEGYRFGTMKHYRPEDVDIAVRIAALEALDSGTTTVLDHAQMMNSVDHVSANVEAIQNSGIRVALSYSFNDVPGRSSGFTTDAQRLESFRNLLAQEPLSDLITLWTAPTDFLGEEYIDRMISQVQASIDLGVRSTIHAGCVRRAPGVADEIDILANGGVLHESILFSHVSSTSFENVKRIYDAGAKVVSIPGAELRGGQGWPVIGHWRALGGKPAVGISNAGGGCHNLFDTIKIGLVVQRQRDRDRFFAEHGIEQSEGVIPLREAVEWATINGAEALGIDHKVGTLEAGKEADIIVIRPGIFSEPVINPWATIVMHSSPRNVDTVMVKGNIVKRDGKLAQDLEKLEQRYRASYNFLGSNSDYLKGPFTGRKSLCNCGSSH